jgi:carbonic anhydrase
LRCFRGFSSTNSLVNDRNHYQLKLKFPPNQWLKFGWKPYRLSEVRFREPGETAVDGKRPPMALQLVHLSPEASFLIVEVPVVVGKENPVIKTLWERIPYSGKEIEVSCIKINVMDMIYIRRSWILSLSRIVDGSHL